MLPTITIRLYGDACRWSIPQKFPLFSDGVYRPRGKTRRFRAGKALRKRQPAKAGVLTQILEFKTCKSKRLDGALATSTKPPCRLLRSSNMRLPQAERVIVDVTKLRDYCLNPQHPRGRHKARVFASALHLRHGDAEILRAELLRAAGTGDATRGEVDE